MATAKYTVARLLLVRVGSTSLRASATPRCWSSTCVAAVTKSLDINAKDILKPAAQRIGGTAVHLEQGRPFALAFIDMRMPPGWDGLETIEHLWTVDPDVQVVICTAYSDYSWSDMLTRLGRSDQLEALSAALSRAGTGEASAVLIGGE